MTDKQILDWLEKVPAEIILLYKKVVAVGHAFDHSNNETLSMRVEGKDLRDVANKAVEMGWRGQVLEKL